MARHRRLRFHIGSDRMVFGPSPPRPAHHEISIPPVGPQSSQGENEVSAVGAAALSRVQHVPNEAAEEDDDHAGGQEKSESCVVDHTLPPNWSRRYYVLRSAGRWFTVCVPAW